MPSCGFLSLHCDHVRLSGGEGLGEACTRVRDGDGRTSGRQPGRQELYTRAVSAEEGQSALWHS